MPDIILAAINAKWIHPSLALRLLKANLGTLEDRCEILEFVLRQPLKEKVDPILAAGPRLLGLSVSVWNHQASLELLKALEEIWRGSGNEKQGSEKPARQKPLVVLGGPEVSWLPPEAEIFRHADYVIRGEGEESFRSLCYRVFCGTESSSPSFPGTEPQNGPVFINQGATTVDVNAIASPYRLYTDEDLQKKLVYVEASRGCPFGCEFCQESARIQESVGIQESVRGYHGVREFPLEAFLADMGNLIDRGGRQFKFLDRTFNLDMGRVKKIMEFFLDRINTRKAPLRVHFEMVPSRFPPELRELIVRFPPGTLRLEVGIQTFNLRTAALIHRSCNPGEETETLEFLRRKTAAVVHADLIAGLPGEDLASFGTGFDRLWRILAGDSFPGPSAKDLFEIQLGILKCLPGTPIARHNLTHGMRYAPEPPYEVMETGALDPAELERIKNFARFWELLVNRNPFPDLLPRLLPAGEPVFDKFMILSGKLLANFGRNWGIDQKELRAFLEGLKDGT